MGKILLLYVSQTGFTQRYAQWIGQELGIPAISLKDCCRERLEEADLVIFGGNVRGSVLQGRSKVERLCKQTGGKPIVWFAVGLRPGTPRTLELLRKNNFSRKEQPQLFYFQGGMVPERLKPGDKTMLACYRAMLKRRRELDPEDAQILSLLGLSSDHTSPEQIIPLIQAVRSGKW